jgi:hypothetical protein
MDCFDLQVAASVNRFRECAQRAPTATGECPVHRYQLCFESERSVVEGRPK